MEEFGFSHDLIFRNKDRIKNFVVIWVNMGTSGQEMKKSEKNPNNRWKSQIKQEPQISFSFC